MSKPHVGLSAVALVVLWLLTGGAQAANPKDAPDNPEWVTVWLGHFTGGRAWKHRQFQQLIDWNDTYVRFPSHRSCARWQRDMRATYRNVEGYRTCLLIR